MLVMATAMLIAGTDEAQAQFRGRKGKSGSIQRSSVKQAGRKTIEQLRPREATRWKSDPLQQSQPATQSLFSEPAPEFNEAR